MANPACDDQSSDTGEAGEWENGGEVFHQGAAVLNKTRDEANGPLSLPLHGRPERELEGRTSRSEPGHPSAPINGEVLSTVIEVRGTGSKKEEGTEDSPPNYKTTLMGTDSSSSLLPRGSRDDSFS